MRLRRLLRPIPWAVAGGALFMLACRACAPFARLWQASVSLPLLRVLHALTARRDAPAIEIAVLTLPFLAAWLMSSRRPRTAAALLLALPLGFAVLWYPAYWAAPSGPVPAPGAAALESLCASLTDELARTDFSSLDPAAAIRCAGEAARLPWARVKPARHPGWMRALGIAGVFSPWTGEAVVDPGAPAALVPFTAVHELMHLRGIADEGAANIAAWERCVRAGGVYAGSARLWALRYALGLLDRLDPAACLRAMDRVGEDVRQLCRPAAGGAPAPFHRLCSALGIGEAASDYGALAAWLAAGAPTPP